MSLGQSQQPGETWRDVVRQARALLSSRLCVRIAVMVFLGILAVEAAILIPSYYGYKKDLLLRLEDSGHTAVIAGLREHANDDVRDLLIAGRYLARGPRLRGGAIYGTDGEFIGSFGVTPELSLPGILNVEVRRQLSSDGMWYDVRWTPEEIQLPYHVVGRMDASWINGELWAFLLRIVGLVLVISLSVTGLTFVVLGRYILSPMLDLSGRLVAAQKDPDHADRYVALENKNRDELGAMVEALNALLKQVSTLRLRERRENEQRFKDFANAASDWFWEMDETLHFSYFSPRFEKVSGVSPDALLGKTWRAFADISVRSQANLKYVEALRAHMPFRNFEFSYRRADGETSYQSANGNPIFDERGRFKGYRGTGRDVTASHLAGEQLRMAKEVAEAANRAKSEFLANMSHELRTPLNAINGFSELMISSVAGTPGSEKVAGYARDINESGQHLLQVINDILDLSKIEAGKLELYEDTVDIAALLKSCITIMNERIQERGLSFACDLPQEAFYLWGDERKLKQVLINLLSNAVKFTPEGGSVTLEVSASEGDCSIQFRVIDSGIGMSPASIPQIMEPFTQVDSNLNRKYEGTGLGLPLTKALVELHGGRLELRSQLGEGTVAVVCLPAERQVLREDENRVSRQAG